MSHFSLFVPITAARLAQHNGNVLDALKHILMPFHEFECTGYDNEYVQSIDILPEAREAYATNLERRVRLSDGTTHSRWSQRFYQSDFDKPVDPVTRKLPTKFVLPEGAEELEMAASSYQTFEEYLDNEYEGTAIVRPNDIVVYGIGKQDSPTKFGWRRLGADGMTIELVRRSNPNRHWDWWQVGGRYSGRLPLKGQDVTGHRRVDVARVEEIDFDTWRLQAAERDAAIWAMMQAAIDPMEGEAPMVQWSTMLKEANIDFSDERQEAWKQENPGVDVSVYHEERRSKIDGVRKAYNEQSVVKRLNAHAHDDIWQMMYFDNDRRERFATWTCQQIEAYAAKHAVGCFAFLDREGVWHERGKMLWFAAVADEKDMDSWQDEINMFLSTLQPDDTLAVVDCHI